MLNIIDYIKWRGDLSFEIDPFNKVDALIFSRFAYIKANELFKQKSVNSIQEIANYILNTNYEYVIEEDKVLLNEIKDANRFKDLKVAMYKDIFLEEKLKQFAAMCFEIDRKHIFIAYRGTDNSLLGWKEDFLMTYQNHIPSQLEAVNYLNMIAKKTRRKIYLGGHSKGGNLAHYAAIYADDKLKERIVCAYSFDGPGFQKEIVNSSNYTSIKDKLFSFIPQSSIIGKMLDQNDKFEIIHSFKNGYTQHNLYTWEVLKNDFIYEENNTFSSRVLDSTFEDYLNRLSSNEREKIVTLIFEIAESSGFKTIKEIKNNPFSSIKNMIETTSSLDKESGRLLLEMIKVLVSSASVNAKDEITKLKDKK